MPLFKGISFNINEGDRIALVARNGIGKTTLLRILSGKEVPDSGTAKVHKDVHLVLFEQDPQFIETASVTQNLFNQEHPIMKAISNYEMAMEKGYKVDNNFVENLSNSYIAAGMPQKGMEMLLKLLEKRPGDIDLLNNVANNYYSLGNYKEAINYWDKVLYLDREEARALYMIGMSYIKMGDKNKGATLCNKAIEMDPSLKQFRNVSGGPFGG